MKAGRGKHDPGTGQSSKTKMPLCFCKTKWKKQMMQPLFVTVVITTVILLCSHYLSRTFIDVA